VAEKTRSLELEPAVHWNSGPDFIRPFSFDRGCNFVSFRHLLDHLVSLIARRLSAHVSFNLQFGLCVGVSCSFELNIRSFILVERLLICQTFLLADEIISFGGFTLCPCAGQLA